MPVKKGRSRKTLPDPRMNLQQRRAQVRRLVRLVDRRIRRALAGAGTQRRLASLQRMHQMLVDEVDRLSRALKALEDHGPAYQVRVPGSGERIRLYRRKRR